MRFALHVPAALRCRAMNFKSLADSLKKERLRNGLTQEGLAERAGISVSTVAAAETGRRNVRLDNLLQMCRVLDVTLESLASGERKAGMTVEQESQFEVLLDRYLEGQRNLWLFLFHAANGGTWRSVSRSGETPEGSAKKNQPKARVRHSMKS